uniref:Uncharacterized protein n=1 Tax=Anguilla anguilla TaxID=7936 RepID=A0A0E9VEZ9_ANGAN
MGNQQGCNGTQKSCVGTVHSFWLHGSVHFPYRRKKK